MDLDGVRAAGGRVVGALEAAARATGVDFGYLVRTARRESAMNPAAQARTSSAAGLFQFVEQTWLGTLKRHGAAHGYGEYAEMITGSGGRYGTVSAEARRAVLNLRFDPRAAALMAGELTSDSAAYLRGRIGREPTGGELYAAHFLGPAGSARLIQACESNPAASAVSMFPQAAAANRSIFYRSGRPASVSEVYANLMRHHEGAASVSVREIAPDIERPATLPPANQAGSEREPTLSAALARIRAQQAMVVAILSDGGGSSSFGGFFGERSSGSSLTSGYSSRIAAMLSDTGGSREPDSR